MDARTPSVSRREVGKAERRRRIVAAADALAREAGFDEVSMARVAERAGVAPATLYNLFQTKVAIFQQVFDLDLEAYSRKVAEAPARDAIERIFFAIDLAASLYRSDPDFYRAMARVSGETEGLRTAISEPRIAFWQAEIARAMAEGALRADVDPDILGVTVNQFMRGVFLDWATCVISPDRLAAETAYGFALALLPYATEGSAPALKARIAELKTVLAAPRGEGLGRKDGSAPAALRQARGGLSLSAEGR